MTVPRSLLVLASLGLLALQGCNDPVSPCSQFDLVTRTITVDGDTGDWQGIASVLKDSTAPASSPLKITGFYVAADASNIYARMDLQGDVNSAPPPDGGQQGLKPSPLINVKGQSLDSHSEISLLNSNTSGGVAWNVNQTQETTPLLPATASVKASAQGTIIEIGFARARLGDPFSLQPQVTYCCSPDSDPPVGASAGCVWTTAAGTP